MRSVFVLFGAFAAAVGGLRGGRACLQVVSGRSASAVLKKGLGFTSHWKALVAGC